MIEFEGWPKTPRLSNSQVTMTEKIDGTNAAVIIDPEPLLGNWESGGEVGKGVVVHIDGRSHLVGAQSRKRLITPGDDNAGFARWVWNNAEELTDLLGPGRHFGEWWGQGIQRRYNMPHKVFSLFNYHRFSQVAQARHDWRNRARAIHMTMVPLLYVGRFSDLKIQEALDELRWGGSQATPEWGVRFDRPEGIIIRHQDLGGNLKAFVEDDNVPKSLQTGVQNRVDGEVTGKLIQGGNIVGNVTL